jgi:hypothetical protein
MATQAEIARCSRMNVRHVYIATNPEVERR